MYERQREGEREREQAKKAGIYWESKSIFVWLTVRYDTANENVHQLSVWPGQDARDATQ